VVIPSLPRSRLGWRWQRYHSESASHISETGLIYTPELAERIFEAISSGRTINEIAGREGFPARSTIYAWKRTYEEFSANLERAREDSADAFAEQALEKADDDSGDDGNDSVQRSRLQVDMRKWLAAKFAPHRYGDFNKTEVNHTGKVELGLGDVLKEISSRTRGLPQLESPEPAE